MGESVRPPRLLVVTDRRRLVAAAGGTLVDWPQLLVAQVSGALAGGADLIQIREPDLEAKNLSGAVRRLFAALPGCAPHVLINDRVDIARVTGAGGVHLTERSVPLDEARAVQPPNRRWVIGRSVHDPDGATRARGADYLVAGTVRASASKPDLTLLLGWTGLAAIVRAAGDVPVLAIGGLGPEHAAEILHAGAAGIAGIGCFLPIQGEDVAASVRDRVLALRLAFDRG
jgi:thiamine-phosphate pyrophosphorylase